MISFAHITDVHLPIPDDAPYTAMANKRALGFLSWRTKRYRRHTEAALAPLCDDIRNSGCENVLLSGDLVNIALPSEFARARQWLGETFPNQHVVFAPGNHDTYVKVPWQKSLGLFEKQMLGRRDLDEADRAPNGFEDFPFIRLLGGRDGAAIIAANSSPSTPPGLATGSLGHEQCERIRSALSKTAGMFRVLMLHHPINDGVVSNRKGLTDRAALRDLIKETGVELVVHGHAHVPYFGSTSVPGGTAPVIGGGSASHPMGHGEYRPARYNLFSVEQDQDGLWSAQMDVRELDPASMTMQSVDKHSFDYPVATMPEPAAKTAL